MKMLEDRIAKLERDDSRREIGELALNAIVGLGGILLGVWLTGRQTARQRREDRMVAAIHGHVEVIARSDDVVIAMLTPVGGRDDRVRDAMRGADAALWKVFTAEHPNIRTSLANTIHETLVEMRADLLRDDVDAFERHRAQLRISKEELAKAVQELLDQLPRLPDSGGVERRRGEIIKAQLAVGPTPNPTRGPGGTFS